MKYILILKKKNSGLTILEFLRRIGEEGVERYEKLDELYVPPVNYDEIKEALQKDQVLFLTGTQEYGKTYTAVHLLWEYYNKGYEPVWFKGAERKEERSDVRSRFENVEKYLKPKHIIYFEDPFGKTEYEVTVDEGLLRNIASIIDTIENVKDIYVIITSREEVFKQFEHNIIAEVDLRKFEKKISVNTPSYNYEKRKEMLLRYAAVMGCKWREDEVLNSTVLEAIKDKSKLPTPLNIEQFARATATTRNVLLEKNKLLEKIEAKSKETAKSFAQEIKTMSADKILFLSFPFISNHFSVDFVKENYQKLVNELKIEEKRTTWEFDRILEWFENDKIEITDDRYVNDNVIRFSHPSYSEALPFLLLEDAGIYSQINIKFFITVLMKLADNKDGSRGGASDVSNTVAKNFDKLPENARNELLTKLSDKKDAAYTVSNTVAKNFDKLPEKVRNELLMKLADKEYADIVNVVSKNFDKLHSDVRNDLLMKLADNKDAARGLASIVSDNFDKLPENTRNELRKRLGKYGYSIYNKREGFRKYYRGIR